MLARRVARAARPGLLATAARTAVVAGTATAVSGRVAQRQHDSAVRDAQSEAWEAQQAAAAAPPAPAPAPAPAAPAAPDSVGELERLAALHQQGVLTDEEFTAAKSRLLGL